MSRTRVRRLCMLAAAGLLALGLHAAAATAGTSTFAGLGTAGGGTPVLPVETHTLPAGAAGSIFVVIAHGNALLGNASATTPLSFPPVPPGHDAYATPFVLGGQCGPRAPAPRLCIGVQTGGSGDRYDFFGGAGISSFGPDAFKGSDGCTYSPMDTCLSDTPTWNVSAALNPGDTSAAVGVSSTDITDGPDCLNWVAQVFGVGPEAAWASAGFTADGTGLRNSAIGNVVITGVPAGSEVSKAYLYWGTRGPLPDPRMTFNGMPASGTIVGSSPDPCWTGMSSFAFRADVTALVPGNGLYVLSGYPTSSVTGLDPWTVSAPPPHIDGASLFVFFKAGRREPQHFKGYDVGSEVPIFAGEDVVLEDQFIRETVHRGPPRLLLTPVEKRRAGRAPTPILRPDEHLKCYRLTGGRRQDRSVFVSNQFVEDRELFVKEPNRLCAPASKSPEGPPTVAPADTQHYKCYRVEERPPLVEETVDLIDQFGFERAVVRRAELLCNPVTKERASGERVVAPRPEEHLVCYGIRELALFEPRFVFTLDQFGSQRIRAFDPLVLCVPSTKREAGPIGVLSRR